MDDHKLGLEPTARANLRGWWGEDNCAMSVQGHERKSTVSFDHVGGGSKQRRRNGQAERLCCL